MEFGSAEWLYDTLHCARGQAKNLIKLHKSQLASDRTGCRSPLANKVRLVLHTAAYWLMRTVRDTIPTPQPLATAEFTTLRMRLLKIATRTTIAGRSDRGLNFRRPRRFRRPPGKFRLSGLRTRSGHTGADPRHRPRSRTDGMTTPDPPVRARNGRQASGWQQR